MADDSKVQGAFLALVLVQAAHSVEEHLAGLYAVFAPARIASGLVSDDPALGFAILNAALVAFGLWCWAVPVRRGWPSARLWIWPWIAIEVGNGVGHPAMAIARGGYFPGVITAPVLLVVALGLSALLRRRSPHRAAAGATSRYEAHPFAERRGAEKDGRCAVCGEKRANIRHHPTRIRAANLLHPGERG